MSLKCLYCEYMAGTEAQLSSHQSKFHERLLAIKGNEVALRAPPPVEHKGWPPIHKNGAGWPDCPVCKGCGFVTLNVPVTDKRWGKAHKCPRCYNAGVEVTV